jgi:uncharacterized membrane protein HdeD (DUF308 family)
MIRLAMLLVGTRALRRKWAGLAGFGLVWMALGLAIMADAADRVSAVTREAVAVLLLFEGFIALAYFTLTPRGRGQAVLAKGVALIILGCMVLDFPFRIDVEDSLLFGMAFVIDGAARIATAAVVRFPKWPLVAAGGAVELTLGALALWGWPLGYRETVPFCIGVALLLSGWTALRLGLNLRRLPDATQVLGLPLFDRRGWYRTARPRAATRPSAARHHETPLVVHVWTPVGSAAAPTPERRLLIDRYIAAVDGKGVISTGHAALELAPDVYISHYPALDIDHSPEEFARLLRATAENDVRGQFQPSYGTESADWCPADANVAFHAYDEAKLRAHWEAYRTDDTYNLTDRNCSITVAVALEAALEGMLGDGAVWRRFFALMVNPDLWIAAVLRARAESMTWTPGLVLDYARSLQAVVEPAPIPWRHQLRAALGRRGHGIVAKRPA